MVGLWEFCRSPNTAKNSILSLMIFLMSSFCAGQYIARGKKPGEVRMSLRTINRADDSRLIKAVIRPHVAIDNCHANGIQARKTSLKINPEALDTSAVLGSLGVILLYIFIWK